jgi:hypothetical protein
VGVSLDRNRRLVMATAKTVLGHALPIGHPLTIVDEPAAPGEVDEQLATRLQASKLAGYQDELHATPVETPEQERSRLALEALRDARGSDTLTPTDDLLVHPEGTPKAGRKVTKDDLLDIAAAEGVTIETDDNKPDLIRKITEKRAAAAVDNSLNAESAGAGSQGDTAAQGATGGQGAGGADSGPAGDAHGSAGEGPSDAD